jgi:hypothetical protein
MITLPLERRDRPAGRHRATAPEYLVLTAASDVIVGNASVDDAGEARGLRSTAVQLGEVKGATILGSVLISRVGSVLDGQLTGAGTPRPIAAKLTAAKELVAQSVAPPFPGAASFVALLALYATGERDADAV